MISSDLTSTFFDVSAFIIHILPQSNGNDSDTVTMIGKHWARSFYWIPKYVFGQDIGFKDVDPMLFPKYTTKSDKVLLVLDRSMLNEIRDKGNQQDYVNQLRNCTIIRPEGKHSKKIGQGLVLPQFIRMLASTAAVSSAG